jgi:hypothetical protein
MAAFWYFFFLKLALSMAQLCAKLEVNSHHGPEDNGAKAPLSSPFWAAKTQNAKK